MVLHNDGYCAEKLQSVFNVGWFDIFLTTCNLLHGMHNMTFGLDLYFVHFSHLAVVGYLQSK